MRTPSLHRGQIVLPIEDGQIIGYAIYLRTLELNGKRTHIVSDTALQNKDGKLIFNVAEYDSVIPLNESGSLVASQIEEV